MHTHQETERWWPRAGSGTTKTGSSSILEITSSQPCCLCGCDSRHFSTSSAWGRSKGRIGLPQKGVRKRGVILFCVLFRIVCVCLRFESCFREPEISVCLRLRAFVCFLSFAFASTPFYFLHPLSHPPDQGRPWVFTRLLKTRRFLRVLPKTVASLGSGGSWVVCKWAISALSDPVRLRVQSRPGMQLRIATYVAFLFRTCFERGFRHYSTTVAWLSPLSGLERGGWEFLLACGCETGRDRASNRTPYHRGDPIVVEGLKQR